jgi:hypothetical protein
MVDPKKQLKNPLAGGFFSVQEEKGEKEKRRNARSTRDV